MPIVEVTLAQGRTPVQLRTMITKLTDAVADSGVAPKSGVRVIVREIPKTHFAAGDVTLAEREEPHA